MAIDLARPFSVRVRVLTADSPQRWQVGLLDPASCVVAVGEKLFPERLIVAIACHPSRAREDDGPQLPDPEPVPVEHLVLYGTVLGFDRDRLEAWAWPELHDDHAKMARVAVRRPAVTSTGAMAVAG